MKLDFSWTDFAACKGMPTAMFYPDDKAGAVSPRVREVCSDCAVADLCDEHAMRYEQSGYWNGQGAKARKIRRRALGISVISIHEEQDEWGTAG